MAPALCLSVCVIKVGCHISVVIVYIVYVPRIVNRHGAKGTGGVGAGGGGAQVPWGGGGGGGGGGGVGWFGM